MLWLSSQSVAEIEQDTCPNGIVPVTQRALRALWLAALSAAVRL
jgi:hypothetical protein